MLCFYIGLGLLALLVITGFELVLVLVQILVLVLVQILVQVIVSLHFPNLDCLTV